MNRLFADNVLTLVVGLFQGQLFSVALYCEHRSHAKLLKDISLIEKACYFQEYEMSYLHY